VHGGWNYKHDLDDAGFTRNADLEQYPSPSVPIVGAQSAMIASWSAAAILSVNPGTTNM